MYRGWLFAIRPWSEIRNPESTGSACSLAVGVSRSTLAPRRKTRSPSDCQTMSNQIRRRESDSGGEFRLPAGEAGGSSSGSRVVPPNHRNTISVDQFPSVKSVCDLPVSPSINHHNPISVDLFPSVRSVCDLPVSPSLKHLNPISVDLFPSVRSVCDLPVAQSLNQRNTAPYFFCASSFLIRLSDCGVTPRYDAIWFWEICSTRAG